MQMSTLIDEIAQGPIVRKVRERIRKIREKIRGLLGE